MTDSSGSSDSDEDNSVDGSLGNTVYVEGGVGGGDYPRNNNKSSIIIHSCIGFFMYIFANKNVYQRLCIK